MEKHLRLSLYSGIALIIISMLFLGREQETFIAQAALAIAVPAIFYSVGMLVYRYLRAPLAAPGIIATGAWLVAVQLIHLWSQKELLPDFVRPYSWLIASLLAAGIITLTGHRVRIWLLVPLVPLTQINAVWSVLGASTLNIEWWSAVSFLLVLAWWENRWGDEEWGAVYKTSAVLLAIFLLIFSYWLPAPTERTMLTTWVAGTLLVAFIGIRHSLVNMGPLALAMLTCATAWGLPPEWWAVAWLIIAAGTILFIERIARLDPHHSKIAIDLSIGLGVLLCGAAALMAKSFPFLGIPVHPALQIVVLLGSGFLLGWMGYRGSLVSAEHAGLWLFAAGWAEFYFFAIPNTEAFGLWLSLLAALALLAERLLTSARKQKRKMLHSILETIVRWSLADLILGLTTIIIIWCAMNVITVPPLILSLTLLMVIAIWLVAGLIYRLPVLLHVALIIAPLPYALLLILAFPPLRSMPMIGLAWQVLAIGSIVLGHIIPKYRPAMLAPFFVAGYGWLAFGMTLTFANPMLLVVGLGLTILMSFAAGIAAVTDGHPAWSALVAWLVSPEERPYAFKYLHNSFLFMGAWLMIVWLQLMLEYTQLATSHKGVALVVFSCLWIMLARLLEHLPGLVGMPIYVAGWLMWLMGLLQVFFAPAEALITAIVGLLFTGDALYRSRERYWLPVFVLQVVFSALQIAWSFDLPGHSFMLAVLLLIALAGMRVDRMAKEAARLSVITTSLLTVATWVFFPDVITTSVLALLCVAAAVTYRRWEWLSGVCLSLLIIGGLLDFQQYPLLMLVAGVILISTGLALVLALRPARFRTLQQIAFEELDWASPLLWTGGLLIGGAAIQFSSPLPFLFLAMIFGAWTSIVRACRFPTIALGFLTTALVMVMLNVVRLPFTEIAKPLAMFNLTLILFAIVCYWLVTLAVDRIRPFAKARWLVWWVRPALFMGNFLAFFSTLALLPVAGYIPGAGWMIANLLALVIMVVLLYNQTGQMRWVWAGIVLSWLAWTALLAELNLFGIQWHTLPMALVLLFISRGVVRSAILEYAAMVVLLAGQVIPAANPTIYMAVVIGIQWLAVLFYGYFAGRRIPFLMALGILSSGMVMQLFMLSPWLVPLAVGITIVGGVLIVETQRPQIEQWWRGWQYRRATWN